MMPGWFFPVEKKVVKYHAHRNGQDDVFGCLFSRVPVFGFQWLEKLCGLLWVANNLKFAGRNWFQVARRKHMGTYPYVCLLPLEKPGLLCQTSGDLKAKPPPQRSHDPDSQLLTA